MVHRNTHTCRVYSPFVLTCTYKCGLDDIVITIPWFDPRVHRQFLNTHVESVLDENCKISSCLDQNKECNSNADFSVPCSHTWGCLTQVLVPLTIDHPVQDSLFSAL